MPNADAFKPEEGIVVVVNEAFQGVVCKCGNTDEAKFSKHTRAFKSKSVTGVWEEGVKNYMSCNLCWTVEDYDAYMKSYKNLEVYRASMGKLKKPVFKEEVADAVAEMAETDPKGAKEVKELIDDMKLDGTEGDKTVDDMIIEQEKREERKTSDAMKEAMACNKDTRKPRVIKKAKLEEVSVVGDKLEVGVSEKVYEKPKRKYTRRKKY